MTTTVVLDADGLSALANPARRARLRWLVRLTDRPPVVPAAVFAECLTGTARDGSVNHLLARSTVRDIDEAHGRRAGALRHKASKSPSSRPSGIDALVVAVAEAERGPVVILTSDANDLVALASHAQRDIRIATT